VAVPSPLPQVVLHGAHCVLRPMTPDDGDEIMAAAANDRSAFTYAWVPRADSDDVARYVETAIADHAAGSGLTFSTRDADGHIVGSTRFMNAERWMSPDRRERPDASPDAIEIGGTWLTATARRTGINTEAKLLMLAHAFDVWRVRRVTIKTDARNVTSRRAIERLGAHLDGVLRSHMRANDGTERDSAWYSITAAEWPTVARNLQARLLPPASHGSLDS